MSTNNSVGVGLAGSTGTGTFVGSTSPTLVTPVLGTPTSGTLTNCTGLPVAGGGTGIASATAYAVLCAGTTTTGAFQPLASLGNSGYVLTSNGAGALPSFQVVGGGPGTLSWATIVGTSQSAATNSGYVPLNVGLTTITCPAIANLGDEVVVEGYGSGGWTLAANTGQTIIYSPGGATSSGGSLSSTDKYDNAHLVCVVASTTWKLSFTNSQGLTIV